MNRPTIFFLSACCVSVAIAANEESTSTNNPEKINYSIGYRVGNDFNGHRTEIRPELIIQGIKDAMNDRPGRMTAQEMHKTLAALGEKVAELKKTSGSTDAQKMLAESRKFLEQNKLKPGVKTTASGLQYRIVEKTRGQTPTRDNFVLIRYVSKLADGTLVDNSHRHGQKPEGIRVKDAIPGLQEALLLMKRGERWLVVMPPELAYGESGLKPDIPPNSALIYDVELLSVRK